MNSSKDAKCSSTAPERFVTSEDISGITPDEENMEIDESKSGESWIHGLTEGEYSDLSVEERLDALVTLIGVANEGNSIRVVLEVLTASFEKKKIYIYICIYINRVFPALNLTSRF